MPKRGQGDDSPGDRRKPYSDLGGAAGAHARTHDVHRERVTNPQPRRGSDEFAHDLEGAPAGAPHGHEHESAVAVEDKRVHELLPDLADDELARLSILQTGARLEEGGVYIDLNELDRGPFTASAGLDADEHARLVAKRDTDHEMWRRLEEAARGR